MMPSIQRPLSGDVLVFDLEEERERAGDQALLDRSGRNARTLLKDGPLRITLIVLAAGGEIPEHQAEGPITVQPLHGVIRFSAGEVEHALRPGQILSVGPGVPHRVVSREGGSFLLTVALPVRPDGAGEDLPDD
jgi:quercetin dioxygenase-like cupin family protein